MGACFPTGCRSGRGGPPCEVPEGGAKSKGGFGEVFDADYSRHNFCHELDEFYELFFISIRPIRAIRGFPFAFVTSYPSG